MNDAAKAVTTTASVVVVTANTAYKIKARSDLEA